MNLMGGATVILAMRAGRRAAKAIGAFLRRRRRQWPVKPDDITALAPPTLP